jgi:hypothetical protein
MAMGGAMALARCCWLVDCTEGAASRECSQGLASFETGLPAGEREG